MITVNGEDLEFAEDATVSDVVAGLGVDPARGGIAAAVNGAVVPRRQWNRHALDHGDRVEVLTAVQGG